MSGLPTGDGLPWSGGPRRVLEWIRSAGGRAVQLDAAMAGIRPRELDRSARRDLAGVMRRAGLTFTGCDLWIPPEHLTDAATVDRAVSAIEGAISMAAELGAMTESCGVHLAMVMPTALAPAVRTHLSERAASAGCVIADFGWRPGNAATTGTAPGVGIGAGVDAAALLLAGADPVSAVAEMGRAPAGVRLSDASSYGRVALGAGGLANGGRLDIRSFEAALVTVGFGGAMVVDVRGVADAARAVDAGLTSAKW